MNIADLAAEPINPDSGSNNMATIRARAEAIAAEIEKESPTPLEIGYVAVIVSILEASNQIRYIAAKQLDTGDLNNLAAQLGSLADYAVELGEAHTQGSRS